MKKTIIFVGLFLFFFAGFRPPAGMSKFPKTSVEFSDTQQPMMSSAILK